MFESNVVGVEVWSITREGRRMKHTFEMTRDRLHELLSEANRHNRESKLKDPNGLRDYLSREDSK